MSQDFAAMIAKALKTRDNYRELQAQDNQKQWTITDRTLGLVGDVGALAKLVMAKAELRRGPENLDTELSHEIADCLWSIIVIADELQIDLETVFNSMIDELHQRIERQKADPTLLR